MRDCMYGKVLRFLELFECDCIYGKVEDSLQLDGCDCMYGKVGQSDNVKVGHFASAGCADYLGSYSSKPSANGKKKILHLTQIAR